MPFRDQLAKAIYSTLALMSFLSELISMLAYKLAYYITRPSLAAL